MLPSVTGAKVTGIGAGGGGFGFGFNTARRIAQSTSKTITATRVEMIQCFLTLARNAAPREECTLSAVNGFAQLKPKNSNRLAYHLRPRPRPHRSVKNPPRHRQSSSQLPVTAPSARNRRRRMAAASGVPGAAARGPHIISAAPAPIGISAGLIVAADVPDIHRIVAHPNSGHGAGTQQGEQGKADGAHLP